MFILHLIPFVIALAIEKGHLTLQKKNMPCRVSSFGFYFISILSVCSQFNQIFNHFLVFFSFLFLQFLLSLLTSTSMFNYSVIIFDPRDKTKCLLELARR